MAQWRNVTRIHSAVYRWTRGRLGARLAGIPEDVLARAREILGNLERQQLDVGGRPRLAEHAGEAPPKETQLDLFRGQGELVLDAIGKVDIDAMTPLAALQLLATLQHRLRGGD